MYWEELVEDMVGWSEDGELPRVRQKVLESGRNTSQ